MENKDLSYFVSEIPFLSVIVNWVGFVWTWIFLGLLSLGVMYFQIYNIDIFETVRRYTNIRNNMGNWTSNILQMEEQEKLKSSDIIFKTKGRVRSWKCYDAGSYYLPLRLGKENLPESIRRGNGSAWKIKKGSGNDTGALQFCNFIIDERSDETITCGSDAFNKTGNSGLFDDTHWCKSDWRTLVSSMTY